MSDYESMTDEELLAEYKHCMIQAEVWNAQQLVKKILLSNQGN